MYDKKHDDKKYEICEIIARIASALLNTQTLKKI